MTKRKDPADLSPRALKRTDLTPKKAVKRGVNATEEGKQARLLALRTKSPNNSTLAGVAQADPDRPLTEKQRLFVKLWAQGESIRSAAMRAGYADGGTVAYRLSADPAILKIYNREKALYEETCQMTRKRVMDGLLDGVEMAKLQADAGNVIAGWREIGKMCGYYEPVKRQIDVNITGDVTVKRLERMSDADLLKLVKGEVEDVAFVEAEAGDE